MRPVLLAAALVLALAVPASAAQVDPKTLVLPQAEVPAAFALVKSQSGVRSNARRARDYPADRQPPLDELGRVTGYQAVYWRKRPVAVLASSADLYRGAAGVDRFNRWYRDNFSGQGGQAPKVTKAWIGVQAAVGTQRVGGELYTTVSWRHGRVIASIVGRSVPAATLLRLARTQQERIAAAIG